MAKVQIQSIEPNIADLANGWLKSYKLPYKLEQESVNAEIDKALSDYYSKNGGSGANRPDAKILLQNKNLEYFPILIEYKGYKDKLVKLDADGQVENRTSKNEPNFKNINSYAVNGAVHYANALLHHTSYTDIIAIGMTGHKDETGKIHHSIGVYFVSKSNLGAGQKVGEYTDLSFLSPKNFDSFIDKVKTLQLTPEELDKLKEQREKEIDQSLVKLNNDIYQNEKGLGENDRVYLVAASIIATLGIPGKVAPLEKSDLKSSTEIGNKDGDIIVRKIKAFLDNKDIPVEKKNLILRTLENTLTTENINKVEDGESQLKRVFTKIVDDLGIYYKIGLTTDFTGKLFNEMYGWLGFSQDKLNDVVLTPSYVATLLVKLSRVNKDSYVWDFATGSAGLLVAAMNEMLNDAKNSIKSPDEYNKKAVKIKTEQLLGIELLSSVYMLAILNMILMGDGSSNILNIDSIKDFDGKYGFGKIDTLFPADAFILNPPYSALGNGMNFVEKALGLMKKGYASIIIQSSSGTGKSKEYNKKILEKHTLLASIKMPMDLFLGKSIVQTHIYVFKVNEKHHKDDIVKFIDFSNDGYTRTNRKKASSNLRDTGNAKERYEEISNLVRFGKGKLNLLTENEYFEGHIDPKSGEDWNQTAPIETAPNLLDFKQTIGDFLKWEVSNLKNQKASTNKIEEEIDKNLNEIISSVEWVEKKLGDLFEIKGNAQLNKDSFVFRENGEYPYFTRTVFNNGIAGYVDYLDEEHKTSGGCLAVGMMAMQFFYMESDFYAGQFTKRAIPKGFVLTKRIANFFISILNKNQKVFQSVLVRNFENVFKKTIILLPEKDGKVDFDFMEKFVEQVELSHLKLVENEHKQLIEKYLTVIEQKK
ncbi:restriction endonuclease subunit S [Chryseobacterium sp. 5_R23647]|uniref:restriction endonuclease subunit S n=1 Tax=Chryseobacterium sp. 5_R23647 TaxID=2258964 RepID=UPI000E2229AF|nr:restriction endonuclease subunit S [Chryseobacterium sp. 5_R23647]REC42602.1 restriction endonuclease subunit M [Chryseobacterium sp. 5_R23647]